jgi:hypothetical protein
MVKIKNGLLGEFSGKLGDVVIYQLNGTTVVRSRPKVKHKKATGKRKQYQDDFSRVMKLMQAAADFIKYGFFDETISGSSFRRAFSVNLKEYRKLERPESIEWMILSKGPLAMADNITTKLVDNNQIKITWNQTEISDICDPLDFVLLKLINEQTLASASSLMQVRRSDGELLITLVPKTENERIIGFLSFFQSNQFSGKHKSMVSNSQAFEVIINSQ